jgi:hypothetical protein
MQVECCETVEVEFTADVKLQDVLCELAGRVDAATPESRHFALETLDWLTRILADFKGEVIAALPDDARKIVHDRLVTEAARYTTASESARRPACTS